MEEFFNATGYERNIYLDFFLSEEIDKTIEESLGALRQADRLYQNDLDDWQMLVSKLQDTAPKGELEFYAAELRREERRHTFLLGFYTALRAADLIEAPTPRP